jgi:hypothetical protein
LMRRKFPTAAHHRAGFRMEHGGRHSNPLGER